MAVNLFVNQNIIKWFKIYSFFSGVEVFFFFTMIFLGLFPNHFKNSWDKLIDYKKIPYINFSKKKRFQLTILAQKETKIAPWKKKLIDLFYFANQMPSTVPL